MSLIKIDKSNIRNLFRDVDGESVFKFFSSILLIYLLFASLLILIYLILNGFFTPFLYPLIFLAFGLVQYVLAQALHEAWHYYFHGIYGVLSRLFISFPLGMPDSARGIHLMHHAKFGDPILDPDYKSYTQVLGNKKDWLLFFLFSFSGLSAIKRFVEIIRIKNSQTLSRENNKFINFLPIFIIQIVIYLIFSFFTNYYFYFIFWVFPILIVVKTLTNVRLILEHGNQAGDLPSLRSFLNSSLVSKLIGAYGFEYHAEHHIAPGVVCSKLHLVRQSVFASATPNTTDLLEIEYLSESYSSYFIKKIYEH